MLEYVVDAFRDHNFRGKLRLLDGMIPHSGSRTSRVFGYDVELDLGEAIQRWIFMGAFEPRETELVRQRLRPGMTFLDVGANVGYFSLLAASRVGDSGRVCAIEPSSYAFKKLARTAETNRITQLEPHRVGLSDQIGELTLYVQPAASGFHSPTMSSASGGIAERVPVKRLDDLLAEVGIESVDMMKMDVEGHELRVVKGGWDSLRSGRIRAILCEFNEHWLRAQGASSRELYDALLEAGFQDVDGAPKLGPETFETRFMVHGSTGRNG